MTDSREPPASKRPSPAGPGVGGAAPRSWILLALVLLAFWGLRYLGQAEAQQPDISYSAFFGLVKDERVKSVTI